MDQTAMEGGASRRGSWVLSIGLTTAGCAVGFGLAAVVYLILGWTNDTFATPAGATFVGLGIGLAFGGATALAQVRALPGAIDRPRDWVAAAVVGYPVGLALTVALLEPISLIVGGLIGYLLTGLLVGLAQWRLGMRERRAGIVRWSVVSCGAYFFAFFTAAGAEPVCQSVLGLSLPSYLGQGAGGVAFAILQGAVVGLTYGLIADTALVLLVGRHRTSPVVVAGAAGPAS